MNTRSNQILLGVILFLLGLFCLFQKSVNLDLVSLSIFAFGFAFALLYRTKRKSWSLLIGAYLMLFGLRNIAGDLVHNMGLLEIIVDQIFSSLFFITPGLVFLILFHEKNKNGLLIPGTLLVAFGLNGMVRGIFPYVNNFPFYVILGLAFLYVYFKGKYFLGKWVLYLSVLFLMIGVTRFAVML